MKKFFFLTPGCFDKGGISRYSRYQIDALRNVVGPDKLWVASLMGKTTDSFEESFDVDYSGTSNGKIQQIKFALFFIIKAIVHRPKVIHVAHINFSGLVVFIANLVGAKTVLNVYGLEIWSKLSRDATWGLKKVDYIISDCHNTKNYLVDNNIRRDEDITVIWDCVDIEKFKPASLDKLEQLAIDYQLPAKSEKMAILTLGRVSYAAKHKGYNRLIHAYAQLDTDKFYLVIAGKGDMVNELKELTVDLNISDSVYFAGMIHEEDMAAIYSYADIFSLVSEAGDKKGEGIPLTPIEAMACGTPIIVGDEDGSREAIIDENGICVASHDQKGYLEAVNTITSDVDTFSKKALEIATQVFSYTMFLEKHKTFYTALKN